MVRPERDLNPRSTTLEGSRITITPTMQLKKYIYKCMCKTQIDVQSSNPYPISTSQTSVKLYLRSTCVSFFRILQSVTSSQIFGHLVIWDNDVSWCRLEEWTSTWVWTLVWVYHMSNWSYGQNDQWQSTQVDLASLMILLEFRCIPDYP